MIDDVYSDYAKRISLIFRVGTEWNLKAEKLFALMDDDKKGHLNAEGLQLWTLSRMLGMVIGLEPILLRKQTFVMLQEMKHTNGLVSMRNWKNYLVRTGWTSVESLNDLLDELIKVKECWKEVRLTVFSSETFSKYQLDISSPNLSTLWEQCIASSISELISTKKEALKLYRFLKFAGLVLGSTPNLATKGIIYIQGTYLRDISEFSVYLMNNYLQIIGQYHTSVSISALTQQAIDTLSSDFRFKAIRKALQTYDSLLNIILYEVIAKSEKKVEKLKGENSIVWQYSSNTSILNGIARSVSYSKAEKGENKLIGVKGGEMVGKSVENLEVSRRRGMNKTPEKARDREKEIRPLTPNGNSRTGIQANLSPRPERRPNDRNKKELKKSPLRVTENIKGDRPKTPTRTLGSSHVEVRAVLTKEKTLLGSSSRTPVKSRKEPQKESYEQVIKRLINKKL